MSAPAPHHLPPDVQAALSRGKIMEAIKLLRQSSGLGLAEAKQAIDAYARGGGAAGQARAHAASHAPARPPAATNTGWASGGMPPHVLEALQAGNKIEAIRRLREITSVDLKAAKDAVEAHLAATGHLKSGLAPGEVPHSKVWPWLVGMAVALGIAVWLWLRR